MMEVVRSCAGVLTTGGDVEVYVLLFEVAS